jgi:hypothetical protein
MKHPVSAGRGRINECAPKLLNAMNFDLRVEYCPAVHPLESDRRAACFSILR